MRVTMVTWAKITPSTNNEWNDINGNVFYKKKRKVCNQNTVCSEKIWKAIIVTLICVLGTIYLDFNIYVEGGTSGFPGTLSHAHQSYNKQKNKNSSEVNERSSIENETQNQLDTTASIDFMGDDSTDSTSDRSSDYDFEDMETLSPNKNEHFNGEMTQSTSYQPLRTLEKLQAMLDETDYATATSNSNDNGSNTFSEKMESSNTKMKSTMNLNKSPHMEDIVNNQEYNNNDFLTRDMEDEKKVVDNSKTNDGLESLSYSYNIYSDDKKNGKDQDVEPDRLWTSKDRSKYRKKQRQHKRIQQNTQYNIIHKQRVQQQHQQTQQSQVMQYGNSDDDTTTDDTDGDGLGYTLPNLPVFFSDGEETESDSGGPVYQQAKQQQQQQQQQQQPPQLNPLNSYSQQQQQQQQKIVPQHGQQPQSRSQPFPYPYPLPSGYNYNFPQPGPYPPMPSQYQLGPNVYNQHPYAAQYAAAWAAASGYQQQHQIPQQQQQQQQQQYQKTPTYPYSGFNNQQGQIARQMVTPYESQFSFRANTNPDFHNKKRNQSRQNSFAFREQYNNGIPNTESPSEKKVSLFFPHVCHVYSLIHTTNLILT